MRKNNEYTGEFKEMVVKNIVKTQQVYTERLAEEKKYL